MKIGAVVAMMAAFAGTGRGQQTLDVFVNNGEFVPFATLQMAKGLAERILATADVRIVWHGMERRGWKGPNRVIIIQLEMATPAAYLPGGLACSAPREGVRVSIFYDRIRRMDYLALEPFLLAHVMVHEVTHLLQGIARHSAAGIMKAHWDSRDYLEMRRHLLGFTPEDIHMIRNAANFRAIMAAKAR